MQLCRRILIAGGCAGILAVLGAPRLAAATTCHAIEGGGTFTQPALPQIARGFFLSLAPMRGFAASRIRKPTQLLQTDAVPVRIEYSDSGSLEGNQTQDMLIG